MVFRWEKMENHCFSQSLLSHTSILLLPLLTAAATTTASYFPIDSISLFFLKPWKEDEAEWLRLVPPTNPLLLSATGLGCLCADF